MLSKTGGAGKQQSSDNIKLMNTAIINLEAVHDPETNHKTSTKTALDQETNSYNAATNIAQATHTVAH